MLIVTPMGDMAFVMLPVVAIGLVAMLAYATQNSWLAPGAAWAAFWFAATCGPVLLAPRYPVSASAIWVIFSFTLVIWLGSWIGQQSVRSANRGPAVRFRTEISVMRALCLLGFGAGLLATTATLERYGADWKIWLSPTALMDVSRRISIDRYQLLLEEPLSIRFLFAFMYMGSLAGGYGAVWRQHESRWLYSAPLLGALIYALLTTAKAGVLNAGILWVGSYAAEYLQRHRTPLRVKVRFFAAWTAVGAAMLALFWAAMLLRYGTSQGEDREFMIERLRNYGLAHVSVFSNWWESPNRALASPTWGSRSLFGPFALLGWTERQPGIFAPDESGPYAVDSNVFTIHRGLIEDFTYPGALLVTFAGAIGLGRAYRRLLQRRAVLASSLLAAFYACLLWSHVINLFGYTSILVAVFTYTSIRTVLCVLVNKRQHYRTAVPTSHVT